MIDTFVTNYLPRLFDWVIETSIMASIVVGLILCVKLLLRDKLSPRWQYILWMIVLVRLLLPWSPESSYSIYSIFSYDKDSSAPKESVSIEPLDEKETSTKVVTSTEEMFPINSSIKVPEKTMLPNTETTFSFYTIVMYVWLAGVILLGIITFIMNRRLLLYIKKQPIVKDKRIISIFESCKQSMSIKREIPLLFAGKIASPTVCGFLRPRLLLSIAHMKTLDEQQLRYIFYHELAHIKRKDVGVNWLMHCLLIINWFNPILWYAYSRMREDQELACDALALTYIDSNEQTAYGHTIIRLLEHYASYYQTPNLANLSRNKKTLKRRIVMIKKFQKKSYRWSALGVVAVVGVASITLFNTPVDGKAEGAKTQMTAEENSQAMAKAAFEKLYGTKEHAHDNGWVHEENYDGRLDHWGMAHQFLTKEEFDKFVQIETGILELQKKAGFDNFSPKYASLSAEDDKKLWEFYEVQHNLQKKIPGSSEFTVEAAQKLVDFPIKKPTYAPQGHYQYREQVYVDIKTETLKPVIDFGYTHETLKPPYETSYSISQSPILEKDEDQITSILEECDEIEEYELAGNKMVFGSQKNDTLKTLKILKMIVPANDSHEDYQIVITSRHLNKEELEKVILSMRNFSAIPAI
jgi:bla regulator protein blaR1